MKVDYKNKKVLSESEVSDKELEYIIEESRLQLDASLLETKRLLTGASKELAEAKCEYPIDPQEIVDLTSKVDSYAKGLEILENLKKELGL